MRDTVQGKNDEEVKLRSCFKGAETSVPLYKSSFDFFFYNDVTIEPKYLND